MHCSNISAMQKAFGNHDVWINTYNKGYAWNSKEKILDKIIPHLFKCNNLLEIAIGYGRFSDILADYCVNFYGIDLNECCVDYCSKNINKGIFSICDGYSIPFTDTKFDIIVCLDSMVHMSKDIIESYIIDSLNKINNGGKIIIHHSSNGKGPGHRSDVYDKNIEDIVKNNKAIILKQEKLWWLENENKFNDSISIISKL